MTDSTNSQEPTVDQKLQQAIEDYGRLQIAKAFDRRVLQKENFDEFWAEVKPGCKFDLTEDNQLTVNGQHPDRYVESLRQGNPALRDKYFARPEKKEGSTQSAPDQQKQASPKPQKEPDCLYISRQQMASRQFMLQAGSFVTKGIQDGRVRVDDSRPVQDGHEIREFLAPKAIEGVAQTVEAKPAPKPRTITRAEAMDRGFTLKLDQEFSSVGGYLRAVQRGDIKISG